MWLAIEGVVGAGKTTTGSLLAEANCLTWARERSEDHAFLADYYAEPPRFALETELAFMLLQLREMKRLDGTVNDAVSDFAPAKNLVFARMWLSPEDLVLLEAIEARLWQGLPSPDRVVYLDVPSPVCLERIRRRGRPYEQGLRVADLDRIKAAYEDSFASLGQEVRVLKLTGSEHPAEVATRVMDLAGMKPARV
jgi:deoxyguanosine kinase